MIKLAMILYIMIAPTIVGFSLLIPLTLWGTSDLDWRLLIVAIVSGSAVAVPASLFVARRVFRVMNPQKTA